MELHLFEGLGESCPLGCLFAQLATAGLGQQFRWNFFPLLNAEALSQ